MQKLDRMNCKLQKLIDEYNQGAEHPISYAVGYEVSYRNHYYLVPDLIRTADEKMYEDKRYKKQHRQEECRPCCYVSQLVHSISSEHLAAKIRMAMHGNQERKTYAFIMSDVQDFRLINDYWGYDTGNQILDTVLKRIETYEDVQFARRFHSDVFVSLLDVTGQDLAGVQQRIEANNKEIEQMEQHRAEVLNSFQNALEKEEISIYLQPKMGGKTEKIESAEVLVRWQKPDGQVWTPDKFLSVLEETGEILELDYYLMRSRWINGFWMTSYPSTEKLSLKKFSIC